MSTIFSNVFSINGVIDTGKSVLENMNNLATAAGAWMTFDSIQGKWAVVINQSGASVKSFNDSNIIGSINISSTGLTEIYNSVEVEFPHKDLKDEPDYIKLSIANGDRYPNEPDNVLSMKFDLVNDPIQAQLLAARELKQSRVDKIIEFRTDFSSLGIKAGNLIDLTNEAYGYTNKVFRVIKVQESDEEDGIFSLSITALEYDVGVYSTAGLTREERNRNSGIKTKTTNTAVQNSDKESLPLDLTAIAKALGLTLVFNALTGRWELGQGGAQANIAGDNAVITWTFIDGNDLDIRCRVYSPDLGQYDIDQYVGWTGDPSPPGGSPPYGSTTRWPAAGTAVLLWGGDNTGTGVEAVAVNISQLKALYPTQQYFVIECRANWYGTPGAKPVQLAATVYQGGTLSPSGFTFTNAGSTKARAVTGVSVYVDSNSNTFEQIPGDLIGYFVFDSTNNTAQFRNDLTGIV